MPKVDVRGVPLASPVVLGLEGIVAKARTGMYASDPGTTTWMKIKNAQYSQARDRRSSWRAKPGRGITALAVIALAKERVERDATAIDIRRRPERVFLPGRKNPEEWRAAMAALDEDALRRLRAGVPGSGGTSPAAEFVTGPRPVGPRSPPSYGPRVASGADRQVVGAQHVGLAHWAPSRPAREGDGRLGARPHLRGARDRTARRDLRGAVPSSVPEDHRARRPSKLRRWLSYLSTTCCARAASG